MAQNLGQVNLEAASAHARDVVALSSHLLQLGFQPLHAQSGCFLYVHPHHHNNAYIIMSTFQNSLYMSSVSPPTYQSQNNYQDLIPSYSTPTGAEGYHYNSNPSFTPSRRTNNARREAYHQDHDSVHDFVYIGSGGRATARAPSFVPLPYPDHIIDNQMRNVELMQQGNQYVQELSNDGYFTDFDSDWNTEAEEALIMDAIQLLGRQNPSTHYNCGGLWEGVISMCLKTRNCDEHDKSDICIVCQDDLCQEDEMVGALDCGHEYHATCIKQWLQEKNICPLCKTIALPI